MCRRFISTILATMALAVVAATCAAAGTTTITPYPRAVLAEESVKTWTFDSGPQGWQIQRQARTLPSSGTWKLATEKPDPILISPPLEAAPRVLARVRMRTTAPGPGQIFWMAPGAGTSEEFSTRFPTWNDGEWHDYEAVCPYDISVRRLRFDPSTGDGEVEIERIEIVQRKLHPLEITGLEVREAEGKVVTSLLNHADHPLAFSLNGEPHEIGASATAEYSLALTTDTDRPFETLHIQVDAPQLPSITRSAVLHHANARADWIQLKSDKLTVQIAPDASGARLLRNGQLAGIIAPLLWDGRDLATLELVGAPTAESATFRGPKVKHLKLSVIGDELWIRQLTGNGLEGPVVRALGNLEQGLLPGLEYLGQGEASSSTLDVHGPEHLRFEPDRFFLTQPLMAFVTDRTSLAMHWDNTKAQPVFATPNFYEGTRDHRMALKGRDLEVKIRVGAPFGEERLEDAILWGVRKRGGLSALPQPPRAPAEQLAFCLESLRHSEIHDPASDAWYHALVPGDRYSPEHAQPFGDHLSTIFRLSGEVPVTARVAHGGAHISNDAIYFLTDRAEEWIRIQQGQARNLIAAQRPDGSYRYGGEFRAGHFEDTSSGQCAINASRLLGIARDLGDPAALDAGLKTLDYMKRFRTPRGAQVWECPLHAPDIMASAHLVRAYTRGYELTGNAEYLALAVRWAISGVPFVYQWGELPIMNYATIATYCATKYEAPVWIGHPVQWCGIVYADAIVELAAHDKTLDWRKLATGILIAGEQQQYTAGSSKGLLADSLGLHEQQLFPFDINPCALVSLRLRLAGEPSGLESILADGARVISPFAGSVANGKVTLQAPTGLNYQALVNGRVVRIHSSGTDVVPLVP